MTENASVCSAWRLYLVLDRGACGSRRVEEVARAAVRGGVDAIQLRDKTASARELIDEAGRVLAVTRAADVPLLSNDRSDVALAVGADGVHLGQDDLPVAEARSLLGPHRIIGQSTHSLEQARAAEAAGVEYIGFGPIFPTPTKPDYRSIGVDAVGPVLAQVRAPCVCIGGIDAGTLPQVLAAGARRIAVVRAICSVEDPEAAAQTLKRALIQFDRADAASAL